MTLQTVTDLLQAGFGLLIIAGFWWAVFAVIRLFEPHPRASERILVPGKPASAEGNHAPSNVLRSPLTRRLPGPACCPDCTPGCPITGLAMGQAWGRGDDWWGKPFDDDVLNSEAMVFWGDGCCPDCGDCPVCQGAAFPWRR